jgi:23S rRNA A2030 N6-methylase RlmJ
MCEAVFIPKSSDWIAPAYVDYALHKQTYAELSVTLRRDRKTVEKYLTGYNHITGEIPTLKKADRICVVIDATYF